MTGFFICIFRFTNLKNHARRHSVIKKYSCAHCAFQHNEHARIRAHMIALHQDSEGGVIDNGTPANIKLWDYLVQKCFAHYLASEEAKKRNAAPDDNTSSVDGEDYKCRECSDVFVGPESPEDDGIVLVAHTARKPPEDSSQYGVFGMLHLSGLWWTVNKHLSTEHADVPAGKNLAVVPKPNYHDLIIAYFPAAAAFTTLRLNPPKGDIRLSNGQIYTKEEGSIQNSDMEVSDFDHDDNSAQLSCRLCNRFLDFDDLPNLVTHAKAHYIIKQFECSRCGYGSNSRSSISQHLYLKHRTGSVEVLEHDDEIIRKAWTQVLRICFPNLAARLKKKRIQEAKQQQPSVAAKRTRAN
ncbi:unnamed protein product [Strongylus vulgaris]|uniref:C2H2-type domain-containing protein n=1 Tax=Strongylus vulgaris TaxID=40348 RepID=A0A3P7I0T9_STRVU|nr:unnamed protein product [Strongylus vulgaris]